MQETDAIQRVWDAIDAGRDDFVDLTRRLVEIPSVNPKLEPTLVEPCEPVVQDIVQAELESLGMTIDRWDVFPDRPNVVGTYDGDRDRSMILCAHVDVVPVGERSAWTDDPFTAVERDGRLYGRGTLDMKSGLAMCLTVLKALQAAGITLDGQLAMHSVVDEEAGGHGAKAAIARGHVAKAAIIPEYTDEAIQVCAAGVEWMRVTIRGRQGHTGLRYREIWPQPAGEAQGETVNAIDLATRFLAAMREFENRRCRDRTHPLMPAGVNTINPSVMRAGSGLGPDGLPLIMATSIIPDVAVIDFSFRSMPQETTEQARQEFEDFVSAYGSQDPWLRDNPIKVQWELHGLHFPSVETPVGHPVARSLEGHAQALGMAAPIVGSPGYVTDSAHYGGAGIAAIVYGPQGGFPHGPDEFVDIDSMIRTTKAIAAAVIEWCGVAKA